MIAERRDFTILVPARNEAEHLPRMVAHLRTIMPSAPILVVDNASEDGTGQLARELGATVLVETRVGKGYALMRGLQAVSTEVVFCCDADIIGLTSEMIFQATKAVDHDGTPLVRLSIGRPPAHAVVTTFLAKPVLAALGHVCAEPLGGLFACSTHWIRQLTLPGDWSFDIALTVTALEGFSTIREIPVNGVTHRARALDQYTTMANEIGVFLVSYIRRLDLVLRSR